MVEVTVEEAMNCTPDDFIEFVLDVHRYAEVDHKIAAIVWARRQGDLTDFKFKPALPGLPGPAPKMVMRVHRVSDTRIEMSLTPLPHNRLNHRLMTFTSSFDCTPTEGGTVIRSVTSIGVAPVARWLLEPVLRRNLPADIEAEMKRAKAYMQRQTEQRPH